MQVQVTDEDISKERVRRITMEQTATINLPTFPGGITFVHPVRKHHVTVIHNGEYSEIHIGTKSGDHVVPDVVLYLEPSQVKELKKGLC